MAAEGNWRRWLDAPQRDEIARNIAELDGLVEEILLASRLDAGPSRNRPRPPADRPAALARRGMRSLQRRQPYRRARAARFSSRANARLLQRLFRNLLENAGRHGGGRHRREPGETRERRCLLSVCDRGRGIPSGARPRVRAPLPPAWAARPKRRHRPWCFSARAPDCLEGTAEKCAMCPATAAAPVSR